MFDQSTKHPNSKLTKQLTTHTTSKPYNIRSINYLTYNSLILSSIYATIFIYPIASTKLSFYNLPIPFCSFTFHSTIKHVSQPAAYPISQTTRLVSKVEN